MDAQEQLDAIRARLLDEMGLIDPAPEWSTTELLDAVMGDKHAAEGMEGLYRKQWKRQNQDALSMHGKLDRLGFAVERIERIAASLEAAQPKNERVAPVPEFNVGDPAYLPAELVYQRGHENEDYHGTIETRILRKKEWWEYLLDGSAGAFIVNEVDLRSPRQQPAPDASDAGGPYTWSTRDMKAMIDREVELKRELYDLENAMEDYGRVMDDMHGLEPDCHY